MRRPTSEPTGDDARLVARVRASDGRAFETLFRAYHAPLCDYVDRFVRSPDETEDLVHDLFTWIWERRSGWTVHGSLRTYLFAAGRNRALNALRRTMLERRWCAAQATRGVVCEGDLPAGAVSNGAEERLASEAVEAALGRVLARLPNRCQMAITLRWRRQLSYAEIATVMGISKKTVEIYMTRATKTLRDAYAEIQAIRQ